MKSCKDHKTNNPSCWQCTIYARGHSIRTAIISQLKIEKEVSDRIFGIEKDKK